MPTFVLKGNFLHVAAYKGHIGLYGASPAFPAFEDEVLAPYRAAKGTLQFSLGQPLPTTLIREIVRIRVHQQQTIPTGAR
jgi:uncharacterized protein YdhG (YjbR/CyaY superfamily)